MTTNQFDADAEPVQKNFTTLKTIPEFGLTEGYAMTVAENDRRIDYIELNVSDISASKAFYGKAFGWTFIDYGPQYCEFSDGRLKGGFTTLAPVSSGGGPLVILFASDLETTLAGVEAAGGRIVQPIYEFPGGRRFHFADPDGYELAVWSDK